MTIFIVDAHPHFHCCIDSPVLDQLLEYNFAKGNRVAPLRCDAVEFISRRLGAGQQGLRNWW